MIHTALGHCHAFTAPHRAATMAGCDVLAAGGSAIEAMVAAAATVAVVYPHMNGIGGDGFWLIRSPGREPVAIAACGQAAALATPGWYAERGHVTALPARGAHAALTAPATVAGWAQALERVPAARRLPLDVLLADAIGHARNGITVTGNQADCTRDKLDGLRDVPGFATHFLVDGQPPVAGHRLKQPALADTLDRLARVGLTDFHHGELAAVHAGFLEGEGSPLRLADFAACRARVETPLSVRVREGTLYNLGPPTQGVTSLQILALLDRLDDAPPESAAWVHALVEATKQAFLQRNRALGDPEAMGEPAAAWLQPDRLDTMARAIRADTALPWPHDSADGDTIWMGAADADGTVVSFIQSVFWEFGSGLTCPDTGVFFQNRGAGFSLAPGPNRLAPGKRPFHTLNPALAVLDDGRTMAYGTMGGEGQPQTQAALFTRHVRHGLGLQAAITAPRWLLGRTWGDDTTSLKLESRMAPGLADDLERLGHRVETMGAWDDRAGHAGAVVRHADGLLEAAADPRSDGVALAR